MAVMQNARRAPSLPPSATVSETETEYAIELDVSDFAVNELSVELDGHAVTVVGEQREQEGVEPFRLRERLEESFRLPDDADTEWLTAVFEHGTLELRAPKIGACPGGKRTIEIVRRGHGVVNADATPC